MLKKISISILLSLTFIVASANNNVEKNKELKTFSITGKVTDNNLGLTGVKVIIDGKETSVYTDFDGNFTINNVTEGNHTISFNMIAYEQKSIKINTDNLNDITVEMSGR